MKLIDLNLLPAQDWLMLRLDQLAGPYHDILSGAVDLNQMEAYCGGIRFALFEFSADARRSPGRYDETARVLIAMTNQVLKAAQEGRDGKPDQAKWTRVIGAITHHREQLKSRLLESQSLQKHVTATRKRETQRLFGARSAFHSLYPIG